MTQLVSSEDGTADYANDNTGQLTGADYDYQADESYQYDENGNRVNNGYAVGTNNQMTSDGTYRYLYDAEGNRTRKFRDQNANGQLDSGDTDITEYAWDHRNRLVDVRHRPQYGAATDKIVEESYDFANRWTRKILDSDGDGTADFRQVFAYDGNQIVLNFHRNGPCGLQQGHLRERYLWGPAVDQILAEEAVDGGTADLVTWTLTDHQNTVRDLAKYDPNTDTTSVANHLAYDAFGKVTSETNSAVDSLFLYTARPFDPDTGLQYNLNRWYDAGTGRWLSEDPISYNAGMNLYEYVGNRPMLATDATGLWSSTPPEIPKQCSGKNVRWTGSWSVSAAGLVFGYSWGDFDFWGKDDTCCTYLVTGKGRGPHIAALGIGWITLTYKIKDERALYTRLWPIKLGNRLGGIGVGVGGVVGYPIALTLGQGQAGRFESSYGFANEGGINLILGMYILAEHVTEIQYDITVPP